MFSVVIPVRNEPLVQWTVDNIRRTSRPDKIIIVYDGLQEIQPIPGVLQVKTPWTSPQGVGKCRDWGVQFCDSDFVVFLDGHMDMQNGWSEALIAATGPDIIACSRSAKITSGGMSTTEKTLSGAYIRYLGTNGVPLEVEWGEPFPVGEVQCCLGACYCIRVKRYRDLGEPCKGAFGWGTSEQTLCMVNEFSGGTNVLADCTTGHIYRGNAEIPYEFGIDHKIGRMFNRLRLLRMLPIPEKEWVRLFNIAVSFRPLRQYTDRAIKLMRLTDDTHISEKFTLSWDEYCHKWWPKKEDKQRSLPQEQPTTTTLDRHERRFI